METSMSGSTLDQPQTSKGCDNAETKLFLAKQLNEKKNLVSLSSSLSKTTLDDVKLSLKQKALKIVEELENVIKEMSNSYEFGSVPFSSMFNSVSPEKEQLDEFRSVIEENQRLKDDCHKKQQLLIDLATTYEELTEELNKKKEELSHIQNHDQSSSVLSSMISNSTDESNIQSYSPPRRLSSASLVEGGTLMVNMKKKELEKKLMSFHATIKQLNDMNTQWLAYNQSQSEEIKQLEKKIKEQQRDIARLEEQYTGTGDPNAITFTPAQQAYIDNEYQRIRQLADRYKDQRDATVEDAQRTISAAAKKRDEALRTISELRIRLEQLERDAKARSEQQEELQTALLVATRSSQQLSRDQQMVSLRKTSRKYEDELRRINEEYMRVVRENTSLTEQLGQRPRRTRQTVVSQGPEGGSFVVMRSEDPIDLNDVEID